MGKYNFDSTDPSINLKAIEASSWSGAVAKVLGFFKGENRLIHVDVDQDGNAAFWDEETDVHISFDADPDTGFELWDVPTTDLWDAPNPGSGAASVQAANDEDRARAKERIGLIRDAESNLAACRTALDILMELVPAESGSILLAEGALLRFVAARGPKAKTLEGQTIDIFKGVAGACVQSGNMVLVRHARQSQHHDSTIDASVDYLTRTLLALPMSNGAHVVGVVELLNPFGMDTFTLDQQKLAQDVANHLATRFTPATVTTSQA